MHRGRDARIPAKISASLVVLVTALAPALASASPVPRAGQAADVRWDGNGLPAMVADAFAYDPTDGGELVYGTLGSGELNETWILTSGGWLNETKPFGPGPREYSVMAYDPIIGAVVLFGGRSPGGTWLHDTWQYAGGVWAKLDPVHSPAAPQEISEREMTFDPSLGTLVLLLSALDFSSDTSLLTTWSFSNGDWVLLGTQSVPAAVDSAFQTLAYDPVSHDLVLPDAFNSSTLHVTPLSYASGVWRVTSAGQLPDSTGLVVATGDPDRGSIVGLGLAWVDTSTLSIDSPTFEGGSVGWTNATSVTGFPTKLEGPFGQSFDSTTSTVLLVGESDVSDSSTGPAIWSLTIAGWSGPRNPGINSTSSHGKGPSHATPTGGGPLSGSLLPLEFATGGIGAVVVGALGVTVVRRRRRSAQRPRK